MRENLEQSRKQANELLEAFRAGDPRTLDQIRWNHRRPGLPGSGEAPVSIEASNERG